VSGTFTCPLCKQEHPEGTDWCDELLVEIPPPAPPRPPDGGAGDAHENGGEGSAWDGEGDGRSRSPGEGAGRRGRGGGYLDEDRADQGESGGENGHGESGACGGRGGKPISALAALTLPSGETVALRRGVVVEVGRLSPVPQIREGLEPFDSVSRRHCRLVVDKQGDRVTVWDAGSSNGTWLDGEECGQGQDAARVASLPAQLRLGQHLALRVAVQDGTGTELEET
jgi:hypothetical protein